MEDNKTWFRKHAHKIGYSVLTVIIFILIASYNDLKQNLDFKNTENQLAQQPVILEQEVVEEVDTPDKTPPKIEGYCFNFTALKKNEERVCIKIDSWNGYLDSVNSVPITGKIEGGIKSITVDGKKITWDENNEIYQRINLYIYGGLNKYKVVVEDMNGNKSTGYVETNANSTDNDLDINLNE